MLRAVIAALHLLAPGVGLGAIVARARSLRPPLDSSRLSGVFFADSLWGLAALLWITTGLWRAFGGFRPERSRGGNGVRGDGDGARPSLN